LSIVEPTDNDIRKWWRWALITGVPPNNPFDRGWGAGADRTNQNQPPGLYCLSCTAGAASPPDTIPRPLTNAVSSGNDILVPVLVAVGANIDRARRELGTSPASADRAAPEFFVDLNDGTGLNREDTFYLETQLGEVEFLPGNGFQEPPGRRNMVSAGFWAKVTTLVRRIEFGGSGGQVGAGGPFTTRVIYQL
jgi:hypothetical protein